MSDMDAYRDVFLAESADYIQQITDGLLALERDPVDLQPVEVIFRGAHSLKGMGAAMGYERTADLTHKMEGLMDHVRKGDLAVSSRVVDLMLAATDLVRDLIDDESSGRSNVDAAEMIAALAAMASGEPAATDELPIAPDATVSAEDAVSVAETTEDERLFRVKCTLDPSCVLKAVRAYMVIKRMAHMGRVVETIPTGREIEDESFDREFTVMLATRSEASAVRDAGIAVSEVESVVVEEVETAPAASQDPGRPQAADRRRRSLPKLSETQTVRVAIGHLDTMVDLVGELVILRSRLDRIASRKADPELTETVDELHRISSELQYEVMQTRMVPVGNIFNRFPRMVRDLAVDLEKRVEFEIDGLDIELDRTVLDEIGDPIVHLLRNSIDHGIEPVEQRTALGKPETGHVRLRASRERDHVAIVVSDDGRGIDTERVWSKACQRGIVDPAERAEYTDSDVLLLTCIPGFSTAEQATKVSGRGVGMDVVKGKIEHLGGTLQIVSNPGRGTDFILRLPLTLAIVRALMVETRGQTFAIPLSAVNEVFSADELNLETIDGAPVAILRDGSVVPLQRLDALLYDADPTAPPEPRSSVVLLDSGGDSRALHVTNFVGRQEIVVKPLSRLLRDSRGFSGATILGDGRVVLILDPRTIFTHQEATR